jgi:molybdopterin synthase sulfur carrier subunit
MAKIIIPTPLRKFTDGESTFETTAFTVDDAISELLESYPDLKPHLLDNNDKIRSFIKIFVGEDDIKALDGESTNLEENTIVSIVPAIAGGISDL